MKQGILTLRQKTIEVVYVSSFEPAQLASDSNCGYDHEKMKMQNQALDSNFILFIQWVLQIAPCPSDSIIGIIFYYFQLFSSSNQISHWELNLGRELSFLSKNVKLFFFYLTLQV